MQEDTSKGTWAFIDSVGDGFKITISVDGVQATYPDVLALDLARVCVESLRECCVGFSVPQSHILISH